MILITGATGFIGSELVKELSKKTKSIRCLVRAGSDTRLIEGYDIEILKGSLIDKESLENALEGITTVIHMAAVTSSKDRAHLHRTNVVSTQNIVQTCVKKNIRKFIFISSINATLDKKGAYGQSKFEAEQIVRRSSLDAFILRPSLVYNKVGDKILVSIVKLIKRLPIIPIIGDGNYKWQPIYIKDLILIIVKIVYDDSLVNETYNVAGSSAVSYNELVDLICSAMDVRRIKVHIPFLIVRAVSNLFGSIVNLSPDQIRELDQDKTADIGPMIKTFGLEPLSIQEGIRMIVKNI